MRLLGRAGRPYRPSFRHRYVNPLMVVYFHMDTTKREGGWPAVCAAPTPAAARTKDTSYFTKLFGGLM